MLTYRSQLETDAERETISRETGLDCSNLPDMVRPEYKDETMIDQILKSYIPKNPSEITFGEINYDMDLQTALYAVEASKRAFKRLPLDLRNKYQDSQGLMIAIMTGDLILDLQEEPTTVTPTPTGGTPA